MGKHVVKSGENIFDVTMKLYGSIEGLVDLLICNQDADGHTGLSVADTLTPGMVLEYSEDYVINKEIAKYLSDKNVRNGEHVYRHYNVASLVKSYAKKFNELLIKKAIHIWPHATDSYEAFTEEELADFVDYVNNNAIYASIEESHIPNTEERWVELINSQGVIDKIESPVMVVNQNGNYSCISFRLFSGVVGIDWGDNTTPDIYGTYRKSVVAEHYYEDDNEHHIRIFGGIGLGDVVNFQYVENGSLHFSVLDLKEVGGKYYPMLPIFVQSGGFFSNVDDANINNLIISI